MTSQKSNAEEKLRQALDFRRRSDYGTKIASTQMTLVGDAVECARSLLIRNGHRTMPRGTTTCEMQRPGVHADGRSSRDEEKAMLNNIGPGIPERTARPPVRFFARAP